MIFLVRAHQVILLQVEIQVRDRIIDAQGSEDQLRVEEPRAMVINRARQPSQAPGHRVGIGKFFHAAPANLRSQLYGLAASSGNSAFV